MNINEFLSELALTLEEESITIDQNVEEIESWDSLGVLSIVSMLDSMGIEFKIENFEQITTIREFINLLGLEE